MKLGSGERTESPRLCIRLNAKDADRELWVRGCLGVKAPEENNAGSDDESATPLPPTPFGPRKFDVRCGIQISLPKLTDMQRGKLRSILRFGIKIDMQWGQKNHSRLLVKLAFLYVCV